MDTQALFSPSSLLDLVKTELPLPNECTSYEHLHELQCLQLVVFLLSVCHVVLVVQDGGSDLDWRLWHFLQTAAMLKTRIPDPVALGSGPQVTNNVTQQQKLRNQLDKIKSTLNPQHLFQPQQEYYPDLVFLFNRCPSSMFSLKAMVQLQNTIDKFFAHSPFKGAQPLVRPKLLEEHYQHIQEEKYKNLKKQLTASLSANQDDLGQQKQQQAEQQQDDSQELRVSIQELQAQLDALDNPITSDNHISFAILPEDHSHQLTGVDGLDLDISLSHESYQTSIDGVRDQLLRVLCDEKRTKRWAGEKITEKEWLANAAKIWLIVKKSPIIFDYNKSLQSTNYKSSYYE